jgi:programmed cell death 6-interacting protein
VHLEKAALLFNVAAVMSQQALQVERGVGEGATQACKLFQVCCVCLCVLVCVGGRGGGEG